MKRDLIKDIAEYDRRFESGKSLKGIFYVSDIMQIYDDTPCFADGQGKSRKDIYTAISNALRAGFMVGYRCARREKNRK